MGFQPFAQFQVILVYPLQHYKVTQHIFWEQGVINRVITTVFHISLLPSLGYKTLLLLLFTFKQWECSVPSPCPSTRQPRALVVHRIFVDALQHSHGSVLLPWSLLCKQWACSLLNSLNFLKLFPLCDHVYFRKEKTEVALVTCKRHRCFRERRHVLEHNTNS